MGEARPLLRPAALRTVADPDLPTPLIVVSVRGVVDHCGGLAIAEVGGRIIEADNDDRTRAFRSRPPNGEGVVAVWNIGGWKAVPFEGTCLPVVTREDDGIARWSAGSGSRVARTDLTNSGQS